MSDPNLVSAKEAHSFNLFRNYEANHPESDAIKPPVRKSEPEVDFSPKVVNTYEAPATSKPLSIVPLLTDEADAQAADRDIFLITDVNEMMAVHNYPAAEFLLGRKLTVEELSNQKVSDLMQPKERLEKQLRDEIERERLKDKMKAEIAAKEIAANNAQAPGRVQNFTNLMIQQGMIPGQALPIAPQAPVVNPTPAPSSPVSVVRINTAAPGTPVRVNLITPMSASPANSVRSTMSSATSDLLKAIQAMPGVPQGIGLNLYNRLTRLGLDDDDFLDSISESGDDFIRRLEALPNPPAQKELTRLAQAQTAVHTAKNMAAGPAAAAPAQSVEERIKKAPDLDTAQEIARRGGVLDFVYDASAGERMIFDPSAAKPIREVMNVIKSQMLVDHPSFANTHFKDWKNQLADKKWDSLKAANADIVKENQTKAKTGRGLLFGGVRKIQKGHDWVPFGPTLVIDAGRLKQGMFSLAYRATGQKPHFVKNIVVSPELRSVLQQYLAGEPMDTVSLSKEEQDWVKHIWTKAGITKLKPTKLVLRYTTKADMVNRLKVLLGEADAGNDNPALLTEMGALTDKLLFRGWITPAYAASMRKLIALG